MSIEFLVEVDKKIYEIGELVNKVSFTDKLNDGCSKLEFSFIDDDLKISNGCIISFKYNGAKIFYGVVFKIEQNKSKEITVTAYDQLRYAKAKDTFPTSGDTITTLVKKMCNYYGIISKTLSDTKYKLPTNVYDNDSWLDILYSAISTTLQNTGKKYCLRDEFGGIALRDLEDLKLDLVLGDESLVYDFSYGKSIDDEFYNSIKIKMPKTDKRDAQLIIEDGKPSISKYGLLQYYDTADEKLNVSQVKAMAKVLLRLYNQETETLNLECLGDTNIRAGSSFYGQIEDIKFNRQLLVNSVTHSFIPTHTMSLEVMSTGIIQ